MKKMQFLTGLLLLCMSVLVQQICLTRILSVMTYFHLAFVSISMAMLGLTAGAVFVYMKGYKGSDLPRILPQITGYYALSSVIALLFLCSTYFPFEQGSLNSAVALLKVIVIMALPFTLAGMAIALCLTRGDENGPISLRYAVDLIGAALGCLLCIPLLNTITGPYAVLSSALISYTASILFKRSLQDRPSTKNMDDAIACATAIALLVILTGSQNTSSALQTPSFKSPEMSSQRTDFSRWNSFSNIMVSPPFLKEAFYWGAGLNAPQSRQIQRYVVIDGMAGTPMYDFGGDYQKLDFLRYDITNLAYSIRHDGNAAVIGVGGGRDVMAARHFGFDRVTVVELNPIIIDLLTTISPFAEFAGLKNDPDIHFNVDDGRSWFARTHEKFNLIQMSMIDTFAATGAGGFTLSENGLYTVEGWQHFLNALTPDGIFTVSRWYAPGNLNETGRIAALALASLWRSGVRDATSHIYLAGAEHLATLLVSKAPFTDEELAKLDQRAASLGFTVLIHPKRGAHEGLLAQMTGFDNEESLNNFSRSQLLDVSAPTDDRPFFFNQLRLFSFGSIVQAFSSGSSDAQLNGVVAGNLRATLGLLFVVVASAFAIIFVLLLPTLHAVRDVKKSYARSGTAYFLLIGLGFMLVEIALIQRTSLFLGHPTHGLAIALFSLILATGIGSFVSGRLNLLKTLNRLRIFPIATFSLLMLTAYIGPRLMTDYESASLLVRGVVAVLTIAPPALLMGFGFPVGMNLAERIDTQPTPWFWSVNGAAGVLASGLAVIISINFSIPVTLMSGAVCYLLLLLPMKNLYEMGR